jgi:hypothetical protein
VKRTPIAFALLAFALVAGRGRENRLQAPPTTPATGVEWVLSVPEADHDRRAPATPGGCVTVPVPLTPKVALCYTAARWAELVAEGALERCSAPPAPGEGGPCVTLDPL